MRAAATPAAEVGSTVARDSMLPLRLAAGNKEPVGPF